MKDFVYIDQLSPDLKDTLSKKQAFSMKALKAGLWGISPDYKDFLDAVNISFNTYKDILTFEYKGEVISYQVIYNYNYVFKIKYLKSSNKLYTNNVNSLYELLTNKNKEDCTVNRYIHNSIFKSVFKQLNGITFDDLYVAERSYLQKLLNNQEVQQ